MSGASIHVGGSLQLLWKEDVQNPLELLSTWGRGFDRRGHVPWGRYPSPEPSEPKARGKAAQRQARR